MVEIKKFCANKAARQEVFPKADAKTCQASLTPADKASLQGAKTLKDAKAQLIANHTTPPAPNAGDGPDNFGVYLLTGLESRTHASIKGDGMSSASLPEYTGSGAGIVGGPGFRNGFGAEMTLWRPDDKWAVKIFGEYKYSNMSIKLNPYGQTGEFGKHDLNGGVLASYTVNKSEAGRTSVGGAVGGGVIIPTGAFKGQDLGGDGVGGKMDDSLDKTVPYGKATVHIEHQYKNAFVRLSGGARYVFSKDPTVQFESSGANTTGGSQTITIENSGWSGLQAELELKLGWRF